MKRLVLAASVLAIGLVLVERHAQAEQIEVLSAAGMQAVLTELQPAYEKRTGNKLVMTFATSAQIVDKIEKGASFDVAILFPMNIDALVNEGKIASSPKIPIAKAGQGVAIKAGRPKPVLATADQFKATLMHAKSIAVLATGQSGVYLQKVIGQLGIADPVNAKLMKVNGRAADAVVKGDAEVAVGLLPELVEVPGIRLVPYPPALQTYASYEGGVGAASNNKKADADFLSFLRGPIAVKAIKAKAMYVGN